MFKISLQIFKLIHILLKAPCIHISQNVFVVLEPKMKGRIILNTKEIGQIVLEK